MVHNEVIKLFSNSLVKAAKDVFYMWIIFFCRGSKEADVGEVTGTGEGTAACSPPFSQCDPHPWPAQLPEQKLSFPSPAQYEMKSPRLCGPIQVLYRGFKWLWKQPGYGPGHSKSLPATPAHGGERAGGEVTIPGTICTFLESRLSQSCRRLCFFQLKGNFCHAFTCLSCLPALKLDI